MIKLAPVVLRENAREPLMEFQLRVRSAGVVRLCHRGEGRKNGEEHCGDCGEI
jgi:hypothetical protein